jgi:aminoglycoside phosphotransferase (APT) family kinase protein
MRDNLNKILKNFLEIGAYTEGSLFFENLQSGHINETFKVGVDGQNYILQRINMNIFREPQKIMENIETVATHLKSKSYPRSILDFVKTKLGQSLVEKGVENGVYTEGSSVWRLMPFVDNSYSILKIDNEQQAFIAAEAFGEYMSYLSDLDVAKIHTILPNFHNADFRIQQHRDALNTDGSKKDPSVLRLKKAQKDLEFIQKYIPYFEHKQLNIPLRVTHNDTKISNILFDKTTHEAACIIDLDTLQTSTLLADFGDMVRTYTSEFDEDFADFPRIEMRFSYFEALLCGFMKKISREILEEEQNALVFGAERTVFVQALRFMTDYLNNDVYYQTHFDDHNLIRAQNQLALFKSILKQREEMEKLVSKF